MTITAFNGLAVKEPRLYLDVPDKDINAARKQGALFDSVRKLWWVYRRDIGTNPGIYKWIGDDKALAAEAKAAHKFTRTHAADLKAATGGKSEATSRSGAKARKLDKQESLPLFRPSLNSGPSISRIRRVRPAQEAAEGLVNASRGLPLPDEIKGLLVRLSRSQTESAIQRATPKAPADEAPATKTPRLAEVMQT